MCSRRLASVNCSALAASHPRLSPLAPLSPGCLFLEVGWGRDALPRVSAPLILLAAVGLVVHDLANRRLGRRRDLHKVETLLPGDLQSVGHPDVTPCWVPSEPIRRTRRASIWSLIRFPPTDIAHSEMAAAHPRCDQSLDDPVNAAECMPDDGRGLRGSRSPEVSVQGGCDVGLVRRKCRGSTFSIVPLTPSAKPDAKSIRRRSSADEVRSRTMSTTPPARNASANS